MQFSIVIATYNRRRLLDRAIASALAQTHPCEVVVVDDCSSDDTPEWVAQLRRSLPIERRDQLVYLRNGVNLGHSASVNRGVEVSRGDWIKLLDDDDYLDRHCVAEFARAIHAHERRFSDGLRPPAALCSCQALQVDLQGNELGRTPRTGPGLAYFIPQEDIHYGMLVELVPFGTPAQVAFRREAFLRARGWDSKFDTNFDDIDAWTRIAEHGDAIFLNQCLAFRTVWDGAYNRQFSVDRRFDTNWSIKQKIHGLVSDRFQQRVPQSQAMQSYLRLHWGIVALKHGQWLQALTIVGPSLLSPRGWALMMTTRLNRWRQAVTWSYRDTQRYLKQQLRTWVRMRSPQSLLRGGWFKLRWQQMRFRLRLARRLWEQGAWWAAIFVVKTVAVRWVIALVLDPLVRWAQRSPGRRAWALRGSSKVWRWLDRDLAFLTHLSNPPLMIRRVTKRPQPPRMTARLRLWVDRLRLVQMRRLWHKGDRLQSCRLLLPLLLRPQGWALLLRYGLSHRPLVRRFVLLENPPSPRQRSSDDSLSNPF